MNKEQHEKQACNQFNHFGNMEDSLVTMSDLLNNREEKCNPLCFIASYFKHIVQHFKHRIV